VSLRQKRLFRKTQGSRPEEIAAARAQADAARMNYELRATDRASKENRRRRADLAAAEADYEVAKDDRGRTALLVSNGVQSRQEVRHAKSLTIRDRKARGCAAETDLLLAGTRPEEIAARRAMFKQAAAIENS